jgi:phosphoribosylformylglycinamidine cyclo-ligase
MYNVFNMGIGMVMAVSAAQVAEVWDHFQALGEDVYHIGQVTEEEGVRLV